MSVLGEIDVTREPQKPKLFLARPNQTVISKLIEAYEVNLEVKLGSINQLTFKLPFDIDQDHKLVRNKNVDLLKERYLVKVVQGNTTEWFIITEINENADESQDSESVTAMSLGYELQDKSFRQFTTDGEDGIGPQNLSQITTIALQETLWSVDYVDGDFDVTYRSFNISSKTALDFLFEIADTFKAVIVWNTVNRKVSFYKQENVGLNRGLSVSYGKYMKSMSRNVKTDEMVTRLKVFGKDDLSIQRVNPTGANYLEDFSYFLYPFQRDPVTKVVTQSSDYMSDSLCGAILDYQELIESKSGQFTTLLANLSAKQSDYNVANTTYFDYQIDLDTTTDTVDLQKSLNVYNRKDITYNGVTSTNTFTLKGGRQHAVIIYVSNMTGLTVKLDGVTKTVSSDTWTVLGKKEAMALNGSGKYIDGSASIVISGSTSGATIKMITCQISSGEFIGAASEGTTITSNGATNSVLTSTDLELDWSLVHVGDTVYIENQLQSGYQFSGGNSDFAGIVQSIDLSGSIKKITLDRLYTTGTYNKGWLITTTNNDFVILERYVVDYRQKKVDDQKVIVDGLQADIDDILADIGILRDEIDVVNNFTSDQVQEMNMFIIEKEWSDTNYINDEDLYADAIKKFEQIKQPQTVIEVDIVNFLEVVESQGDWDKLNLGDTITIKYEKFGVNVRAKIIQINFNYESGDIKLTIANVKEIESDEDKLIKMLYKSVSTSTTVDMSKNKWDNTVGTVGEINTIINGQWDAAKKAVTAGRNQSVIIDERGLTISDPLDPLNFLRATHSVLAITNDGGNSYKHAITSTGIVAERLYGQIIMGENLIVGDADGILKLLGNKGIVYDRAGTEVMKFGLYDTEGGTERFGMMTQNAKNKVIVDKDFGFKIQKYNGSTWNDVAWMDTNGDLNLANITASGTIEATTLKATTKLLVGNINVNDLIANGLQSNSSWIKADMIEAGTITANKIKAGELVVGTNVTMGANATISWSNISSKPAVALLSDINWSQLNGKPIDLAYLSNIDWNRVKGTVVTQGGISTELLVAGTILIGDALIGNLSANKITAGTMSADRISGGTITGITINGATINGVTINSGNINVNTDIHVGNKIWLNSNSFVNGIEFGNSVEVYSDPIAKSLILTAPTGGVWCGSNRLDGTITAKFG
jgi:phage minor structural protein